MQRNAFLNNKKIHQNILPGVFMTAAVQMVNITDSIIAGNILGQDAIVAAGISMPVLLFIQIPAIILAMGGASEAALFLEKHDKQKADRVFSASVVAAFIISLFVAIMSPFLIEKLAIVLSGNVALAELTEPYIRVNFMGIPVLSVAIIFCYFIDLGSKPHLGSIFLIIANMFNLVFDILFLKFFGMGMDGCAVATLSGYLAAMVVILVYFMQGHHQFHLRRLDRKFFGYTSLVVKSGILKMDFTLMSVLKPIIINFVIVRFLGNNYMAVYSVCMGTMLIAGLFTDNIASLVKNTTGISGGYNDYYDIYTPYKKRVKYSCIITAVLIMLFLAAPQVITTLFGITEENVLALCKPALRIFACSFPFCLYNKLMIIYYQNILHTVLSAIIMLMQEFLMAVPLILTGMFLFGFTGICIMTVISEAVIALPVFFYRIWGQYNNGSGGWLDLYMFTRAADEKFMD